MTKPQEATEKHPRLGEQGKLSVADAAQSDGRRDWLAGPRSVPAEGGTQARFGDLKNDQTTHWKVQEL